MYRYIKSSLDWYFGKDERNLLGSYISDLCSGWLISKRIADENEDYSLKGVFNLLQSTYPDICNGTYTMHIGNSSEEEDISMFTVLGALEGMCNNNEACEVADGFYYVGSYRDWMNDTEAQDKLDTLE